MNWTTRFKDYLLAPTHGHILGIFRLVFGAFMIYEMSDYIQIDLVKNAFILPPIHLSYFEWLQPAPEWMLDTMLYIMLVAAVLITLGILFRPACFILGSFYGYFLFLDKGIFNNHLYLFVMLAFVLGFTHADRFFSVKNLMGKFDMRILRIERWEIFIFQLLFAIVYFYGGLAKINPDWLFRFEPVKSMVERFPADHPFAFWIKNDFQAPFLSIAGLLFDLAIPFLLWDKRTRFWSLIPLLFFHFSNSQTFDDIGIFPFIMICATILYFEPTELPLLKDMVRVKHPAKETKPTILASPSWVRQFILAFALFQLLFPFRGLFLPNPVNWTMISNRFSWRMKSQCRWLEEMNFTIQDGPQGEPMPVELGNFLNPMQINVVAHDAVAVRTVAKGLAAEGRNRGMSDPVVKATIKVQWNGYPPALTVKPDVDLSKVAYSPFRKLDWVMPMPHQ